MTATMVFEFNDGRVVRLPSVGRPADGIGTGRELLEAMPNLTRVAWYGPSDDPQPEQGTTLPLFEARRVSARSMAWRTPSMAASAFYTIGQGA